MRFFIAFENDYMSKALNFIDAVDIFYKMHRIFKIKCHRTLANFFLRKEAGLPEWNVEEETRKLQVVLAPEDRFVRREFPGFADEEEKRQRAEIIKIAFDLEMHHTSGLGMFAKFFYSIEDIEVFANQHKFLWIDFLDFLESQSLRSLDNLDEDFYVLLDNKKVKHLRYDAARGIPFHVIFHEALRGTVYEGHGKHGRYRHQFHKAAGRWPQECIEQLTNDGMVVVTPFTAKS